MKNITAKLLLLSLILYSTQTLSQVISASTGDNNNVVIPLSFENQMFAKQKLAPKVNQKGSPFLFESAMVGSIYSTKYGVLSEYLFNYDVENNRFEIYLDSQIKILPDVSVDSFAVNTNSNKKTKYLNLDFLTKGSNPTPLVGFGKLVKKKNGFYIVENNYIIKKEPNYNKATNTGEKAVVISVKSTSYIIKSKNTIKLPLNKKEAKLIFGVEFERIEKMVKEEKMKLHSQNGLLRAIELM